MTWGTKSRQARGYGRQWEIVRAQALARDKYLCQRCLKKGRIEAAECVDHILPRSKGGAPYDLDNLQSLSKRCHLEKTLEDEGRKPKPRIGLNGWPIDE